MALATGNVRSLYRLGALAKLKDELNKYGIAITAVQEMRSSGCEMRWSGSEMRWSGSEMRWSGSELRWSGSEIFDSGDFIVCYSGDKERRQFGTGLLINKKYKHLIMGFSPETDRVCSLWMRRIAQHYSNTCSCATEEKDDFNEDLERIYMKAPKYDIKVVMGDFNAKVGKESGLAPNVRKYSLHEETNNNGWRMI